MRHFTLVVMVCVLMAPSGHAKIYCVNECQGLHGFYQSCDSCKHFMWCNNGDTHKIPCESGLVWDNTKGACTEISTTCNLPDCVDECAGRQGFYQSCDSCEHFIWCNEGKQFELPCKSGFVWDDTKKGCAEISSTCNLSQGTKEGRYILGCVDNCARYSGYYHSCSGCQSYIWCHEGQLDAMTCESGLFWDKVNGCSETSTTCRAYNGDGPVECGNKGQLTKRTVLDEPDRKIAGGERSQEGEWPWMVALMWRGNEFLCTASLIAERWVLTAAHCLRRKGFKRGVSTLDDTWFTGRLKALVGETHLADNGISADVVILHPRFFLKGENEEALSKTRNDIALIRLQRPVDLSGANVRALCLPSKDETYDNKSCFIAGWGQTTRDGDTSPDLHHVEIEVLECYMRLTFSDIAPDNYICINSSPQGDTCLGDSGGPLMCQNPDGRWFQLGIDSYGFRDCTQQSAPTRYVDVRKFLDWIETSIADNGGY